MHDYETATELNSRSMSSNRKKTKEKHNFLRVECRDAGVKNQTDFSSSLFEIDFWQMVPTTLTWNMD